ncbi:hypothetical protein V5O48_018817, partial [Marasmius crinis-equi]
MVSDYTGYPIDLPPTPSSDSDSHQNTPGTRPAEMHGSWTGYGMGTPYRTPMSLHSPLHPAAYASSPHPGSWPVPPMGTPYEPPTRGIPMLYSLPSGRPLPPAQSGGAFDMSAMGEALDGSDGSGRAAEPEIDLISRWAAGDHYGPVLEPFSIHVLNIKVLINPLLSPPTPDSDLPFLKWAMTSNPGLCTHSDRTHGYFAYSFKGQDEPATFPRVTRLTLVPSVSTASLQNTDAAHSNRPASGQTPLPFLIEINSSNSDVGVTCGDAIYGIDEVMRQMQGVAEYRALPEKGDLRRVAEYAYSHNRSYTDLGEGLRKADWMGLDVHFGGIRAPGSSSSSGHSSSHSGAEDTIRRVYGFGRGGKFNNSTDENDRLPEDDLPADNPCTFELLCVREMPMTRKEREAERVKAEMAEGRSSAGRRMSTVSSQSGDGSCSLQPPPGTPHSSTSSTTAVTPQTVSERSSEY